MMWLYFLFNFVRIICATHMVSREVTNISQQNDFQPISARSQTECILKCNRNQKESFYTNENACICKNRLLDSVGYSSSSNGLDSLTTPGSSKEYSGRINVEKTIMVAKEIQDIYIEELAERTTTGIIRDWKPNWEISFDISIHSDPNKVMTFFWCTIHPFYHKELIGNNIPKLTLKDDTLSIHYSINDNSNYTTYHNIGFNNLKHVKILHYTSPRYPAKFKIVIDDIVVHSVVNNNPIIFKNVQCRVGFFGENPANVTYLKYKPNSEYFGIDTSFEVFADTTIEKVLNWPPQEWYVTFQVKMGPPNTDWTQIFYFSDLSNNLGKFLPAFLLTPGNYLRCITLIGMTRDYYVYSLQLNQNVYTQITMEQKLENGIYTVYTYINGVETSSTIHSGYRSFPLVNVKAMVSEKGAIIKDFDYGEIV